MGLSATRIDAPLSWWGRRLSSRVRGSLAKAWAVSFASCVAGWLVIFPGLPILGLYLGADHTVVVPLILVTLAAAMGFLVVAIVAGFGRDLGSRPVEIRRLARPSWDPV